MYPATPYGSHSNRDSIKENENGFNGKFAISILLTSQITSCAATMVSPVGNSRSQYAPVNEDNRGGVVKYLNQGADFVIAGRRENAYRQMYEACNGKYQIDAEGPKSEGGAVMAVSSTASVWGETQYWYIQFSCVKDTSTK